MSDATELKFDNDTGWAEFVKEMESSGPDGLGDADSRIDQYLERMRDNVELMARNALVAAERIAQQQDWLQGENAKIERRNSYLIGMIGTLAPASVEDQVKEYGKQTRTLPNGTFGFKITKGEHVEVTDEEAALLYAIENELEITTKTTRSVQKNTLKAHFKNTGAVSGDGWEYHTAQKGFYAEPAK